MKVTRKEMADTMKIFMVSMLCALPFVIIFNLFLGNNIPSYLMVMIDCVIFIGLAFVGYIIVDKRRKRIAKKREELESTKHK